jgi:hemerythrin-like domain-containing protein
MPQALRGSAVDFFRTVADGCHDLKEEQFFFPSLEVRGWPREQGPTGQMFKEHRLGREYLEGMSRAIQENHAGSFREAAGNYIVLLREHIATEDNVLFPMADGTLTPRDEQWLMEQFRRHETRLAAGTHEPCLELADELTKQLGIPSGAATETPGCGMRSTVRRHASAE